MPSIIQQQTLKTTKPPINLLVKPNVNRKVIDTNKNKSNKINNKEEGRPQVNFPSSYTATTPVYPLTVAVTPPSISEDQLPPLKENEKNLKIIPNSGTDLRTPSKYYEPPKFINVPTTSNKGDALQGTQTSIVTSTSKPKTFNLENIEWKELRKMFLIPDYEFPLDQVSRPSYDDGPSSFQVNPFAIERKTQ